VANAAVRVAELTADSRQVVPGGAFFALRGDRADGHAFVAQALAQGAGALFVSDPAVYAHLAGNAAASCYLTAPGRPVLATLAAAIYGDPSRRLSLLGVTGTNGKTTVTHLVAQMCAAMGDGCALIGSMGMALGAERFASARTTPEAPEVARLLRHAVEQGAAWGSIEVSSIGIAQERTAGLHFRAAALTNITQDHLDFHGDMAAYRAQKFRLFREYDLGAAVVNLDVPDGQFLWDTLVRERPALPRVSFALERDADVRLLDAAPADGGVAGCVSLFGSAQPYRFAMPGRYNLSNLLAAMGLLLAAEQPPEAVAAAVEACQGPPGRLERIPLTGGVTALVDYAHSPDALRHVLAAARELARGRLLVAFGCGGERDRGKRPLMGAVAAEAADAVLITSDNPRGEDPARIIADVLAGVPAGARGRVRTLVDRREAIAVLLGEAEAGDVVLLAGKGHETTQTIGGDVLPFDDREEVRRWATQAGRLAV
jgi:UDP-N-acetylmuramoyl-L-alanyl-D-glutamate--2,6-diaminopimelate ligase